MRNSFLCFIGIFMLFDDILSRIKNSTDLNTLTAVADFVGSTQAHLSRKKKKNEFSAEWAFKISQHYNLSTDWIMTGKQNDMSIEHSIVKDIDVWLSDLTVAKNEPWRLLAFESDFKELFPRFKQWKEKKSEQPESDKDGLSKVV